mmetsp:Transcript_14800/g.31736  ORF Transcript_14800/g.31736 Transcript_14800/m.31736 type:complete len:214 (+) Transcript_14800:75-716(+)
MGWFWEWILQWMFSIGLHTKKAKVVLLGLDNAGKSSLLQRLAGSENSASSTLAPTSRTNIEQFRFGGVSFTAFDVGGHEQWRHLWRQHFVESDAVVFVLDSGDVDRFEEAQREIQGLLSDEHESDSDSTATDEPDDVPQERDLSSLVSTVPNLRIPMLLLCNKQDLPYASSVPSILSKLNLLESFSPNFHAAPCSVKSGCGISEALSWLTRSI